MKESRKDFIKQAHEAACSQWKKNIEYEFPKLFKQDALLAGKWYKFGHRNSLMVWNNQKNTYGFFDGKYDTDWSFSTKKATLATDKEVGDALIKEAKKRGFKEGVQFIDVVDGELEVVDGNVYQYFPNIDSLTLNSDRIYKNGKWAEIIETITKEQAEKELGKTIIN